MNDATMRGETAVMRTNRNLNLKQSLPRVPAAWEVAHFLSKLSGTMRIVATLFMARTFGKYVHSIGGYDFEYAVYRWRGKTWAIPTTPIAEDDCQ